MSLGAILGILIFVPLVCAALAFVYVRYIG